MVGQINIIALRFDELSVLELQPVYLDSAAIDVVISVLAEKIGVRVGTRVKS
jgi:hypothetical protein